MVDRTHKVLIFAAGIDKGGIATSLSNLIEMLERIGCEIQVLVPYAKDIDTAAIPERYIVGYCWRRPIRFNIIQRAVNLFNYLTAYRFYFWGVKKLPHDICIVYFATYNAQWVRYTKKPIIGWFHSMAFQTREEACRSWQQTLRTKLMETFYARFAHLIAISDEVADSYTRWYNILRPDVIPNLLNIDCVLAQSYKIVTCALPSAKNILYVGRISHEKGLDRLISALGRLKVDGIDGWHLIVLGDGPERGINEKLVQKLNLDDRVTFLGMKENPYKYMRAADLMACPSRSEGFGLVIWEALLCDLPVLSVDSGGTRSALRNGEWGCLVDNNDNALLDGLKAWLKGKDCSPNCGFDAVRQEIKNANDYTAKKLLEVLFPQR